MSIYTDNPLLKGHAHIRLLKMLSASASPTDQITCTFETFDLNEAPRYQALSYEWGPKSPVKEINVMGQPTTIHSNLWNFLSRLRSHGCEDYLWCDAIFIDQGNDLEHNHQVQLMAQIYCKAHSVFVWLGEEDHHSSITLRTICLISYLKERSSREPYLASRDILWKGLLDLSNRRYWTRIWIVQEITVARDLEVFCGNEIIPWPIFRTACKFPPDQLTPWASDLWSPLAEGDDDQQTRRRSMGRALHYSTMYQLVRSQSRWPKYAETITTLAMRYKKSECEDRRDRVFALFGISKEVTLGRGFTVDYQKDMEGAFISLVTWEATRTVSTDSLISFALLIADVLNLKRQGYVLESRI